MGLKDETIVLAQNIVWNELMKQYVGRQFKTKTDIYTTPCASSILESYKVSDLSTMRTWPLTDIVEKYNIISSGKAIFPLIHNISCPVR